jgi:hypothetical protein
MRLQGKVAIVTSAGAAQTGSRSCEACDASAKTHVRSRRHQRMTLKQCRNSLRAIVLGAPTTGDV